MCKTKELTRPQLREASLGKCVFLFERPEPKTKRQGGGFHFLFSVSILAIQFSNLTKFVCFLNLLPRTIS